MTTKTALIAVFALIAGFVTATIMFRPPGTQAQQPAKRQQWEYKVVFTSAQDSDGAQDLTNQYNALAAEGWEFVGPIVDKTERNGSGSNVHYVGIRGAFTLFRRQKV